MSGATFQSLIGSAGRKKISLSHVSYGTKTFGITNTPTGSTVNRSATQTWTGQTLVVGKMLFAVHYSVALAVSSIALTVGGVAATLVGSVYNPGAGSGYAMFEVGCTATSGDVTISLASTTACHFAYCSWELRGNIRTVTQSNLSVIGSSPVSATTPTINAPVGSAVVGYASASTNSTGGLPAHAHSWTNLTEDVESPTYGDGPGWPNETISGAHIEVDPEASFTVTTSTTASGYSIGQYGIVALLAP